MPIKWDEGAMSALFLSVVAVACPPSMTDEQKNQIVADMHGRGYDVNWNGIRYFAHAPFPLCDFLQKHSHSL
ncbi:uncharacterized protein SPSK_02105 [Sporothrix schenckii 1099-18]|uniref:Uncharacterized protein n=1 Tax=Sporothrix schenckii 1099-18 TaxID=1397361 RepID=A0A0F2MGQ8_SPOSC|nr:uncharacterized protein SPSK_02105 [Sporothrix schenckii 1099-18]KJR87351.1 hypothetical protein SPSK_02105 [Sporothrix schenckii 1099-18]